MLQLAFDNGLKLGDIAEQAVERSSNLPWRICWLSMSLAWCTACLSARQSLRCRSSEIQKVSQPLPFLERLFFFDA